MNNYGTFCGQVKPISISKASSMYTILQNPFAYARVLLHSEEVTVSCGFKVSFTVGPYFRS